MAWLSRINPTAANGFILSSIRKSEPSDRKAKSTPEVHVFQTAGQRYLVAV